MQETNFSNTIPQRDVFTVSRLIREARAALEGSFPLLWLEGEISNFSRPSSGHMYFSLKDEAAQVRCAMFRGKNIHLRFKPESGMHVLVRAKVSLYEARGDFQLIIEHMEEAGQGALQRAFDALKAKLGNEGLFDTAHKQTLPALPKRIGVVTSPTGAAIRDILSVLKRRFPSIPVLIYPVQVQGESAGDDIANAIKLAAKRNECDVLIVARGGGSLEDLWAFNEEAVARAIHACQIPIISGVGHEVDFTIADFVADVRAPTPSAAAELITPDRQELLQTIQRHFTRLHNSQRNQLVQQKQQLTWLNKRLQQQHPGQQVRNQSQRLDELEQRLLQSMRIELRHRQSQINEVSAKLHRHAPVQQLQNLKQRQQSLHSRLLRSWQQLYNQKQQQLAGISRTLDTVSPLATLQRGYSITQKYPEKTVIHDAGKCKPGDKVQTKLAHGELLCTVDKIIKEP